ncbi:hypothetical protein [Candidatus Foliamicus sp.]
MPQATRRQLIQGIAATGVALPSCWSGAWAQTVATAQPGLILGKGPQGWCDEAKNGGATVRWNDEDQSWWMWYYARDNNYPEGVAPAFGTGRIALAKSADGIAWQRYKGPLTGGAIMDWSSNPEDFDSTHLGSGDVLRHNDEWLLWYFGGDSTTPRELGGHAVPESYQFKGYRCRPGVARSSDGISWTRIRGAATGGAAVDIGDNIYGAFPNGIHDGNRFLMYYTTLSPRIFYWETKVAESTDLVNWRVLGNIQWSSDPARWELGGSNTRHILPNPDSSGRRWLMVYTALDARLPGFPRVIGAAESDDGLLWHRKYNDPILHMGPLHNFDSGGVAYPQLIPHDDGRLFMYYYGFANTLNTNEPTRGIGLAISESGRLTDFRRVRF